MKYFVVIAFSLFFNNLFGQNFYQQTKSSTQWVDSVFNALTPTERIAQLMIIRAHSNLGADHINQVTNLIQKYNVAGLCFFQGGPVRQAKLTNYYQSITKTPLLISMDAEWGLGMRLDSVIPFPKNFALGAIQNSNIVYKVGNAVGEQCKRLGIQLNFAPVADVNNNPNNPVINDRSFGENKYKVAENTIQYMKGLQDIGVMACAKHFPGHGDVDVDSHLDLPLLNKTLIQLNSLELYPFKQLIKNNVSTIMMAHLQVPSIDSNQHFATSLSKYAVNDLLKSKLNFKGLVITDALEMKGVSKFFPNGESSVQALIAGNDLICLPENVEQSIQKIDSALQTGRISAIDFEKSVKKVLLVKYNLNLHHLKPIDTTNLIQDINANTKKILIEIAENSITKVKLNNQDIIKSIRNCELKKSKNKIAVVTIGYEAETVFSKILQQELDVDRYFFKNANLKNERSVEMREPKPGQVLIDNKLRLQMAKSLIDSCLKIKKYDAIIVAIENYSRRPANNFGLSETDLFLIKTLAKENKTISFFFGNPYAIKNVCNAANIIACYDDSDETQAKAVDFLQGKFKAKGVLPVRVCN